MSWCKTCHDYMLFPHSHRCPPAFTCAPADERSYGDDCGQTVHARTDEEAAEKFCEEWDSNGDYDIIRTGSFEVKVTASDGAVTYWHVSAESVPSYTAFTSEDYPASVDTRPKDEDPAQTGASLASGAVPKADAQTILSGEP